MATRLLAAGNRLLVWNRTAIKTAPLAEQGATPVAEICALAEADIVFTMVSARTNDRKSRYTPGHPSSRCSNGDIGTLNPPIIYATW